MSRKNEKKRAKKTNEDGAEKVNATNYYKYITITYPTYTYERSAR